MTLVDCAHNDDLASELVVYLTKQDDYAAKLSDNSIVTIQNKNTKNILKTFLKDTKREDYNTRV